MIYQKSEIIVLLGLLVIFVQGWPQEVPPRGNIVRKTHILQDSINGARAKGANPKNDASHYNILGVANGQNTTTTEPPKIEKKNRNVQAILKKKSKNVQKSEERKQRMKNKLRSMRNHVEIEHINPTYVNATSTTSRPVIVTQNLNYTTSAPTTFRPTEGDISSTAIITGGFTTPIPTEMSRNSSDSQSTTPIPTELKGNTSDSKLSSDDKASTSSPETPVGNTPNATQAVPDSKNATASGAPAAGALANATRSGPDGTPGAGTNGNSTAGSSPTGIQNGASGANSTSGSSGSPGSSGSTASPGSSGSTASPGSSGSGILSLEHNLFIY